MFPNTHTNFNNLSFFVFIYTRIYYRDMSPTHVGGTFAENSKANGEKT